MAETAGRITAHVIPYWPANPYQPLLVEGLRHAGIEVETTSSLAGLARRSSRRPGRGELVHLHWLPVAGLRPRRLARWWLFARRVAALRRRGVAMVWTAHNLVPHESALPALDLWMSRTVARHASRIICHSAGAQAELIARLHVPDVSTIRVIPHGHYIESYRNTLSRNACRGTLGLDADATVFLLLGTLRAYKGVLELVDAFRRVRDPHVRLIIAGKPYDAAVDADVRARVEPDARVTYVPGRIPDDDIQIYLNAADAVVFPYRSSLTSGALILAMSFGRACIVPRLPGMADCLGERGGIFYDAERKDALFEALSMAARRRSTLSGMGAINLQRARAWDWRSIAAATADCYSEAIDAAGSIDLRTDANLAPLEGP